MYEVDFLAVGDESQSGDAIVLRYGDFSDRDLYRVVVIDAGFKETGENVVNHIKKFYDCSENPRVDLVISTHPDNDHASGLRVILEELEVEELWMHQPWLHSNAAKKYAEGDKSALDETLHKGIDMAKELIDLAEEKEIPVIEPFTGLRSDDTAIFVLGPSEEFYEELQEEIADKEKSSARVLLQQARASVAKLLRKVQETWNGPEGLAEPEENATSPRNQTSTVILASFDDQVILFTGDAGVAGLEQAVNAGGGDLNLTLLQIPHHGSKRNVGPSILDSLLGPCLENEGGSNGKLAFISCAKKGEPKHPSKRVTNAVTRRGTKVYPTQGASLWKYSKGLTREGWSDSASPIEFVQDYED